MVEDVSDLLSRGIGSHALLNPAVTKAGLDSITSKKISHALAATMSNVETNMRIQLTAAIAIAALYEEV
jgi:hypothetical protein